ncbi:hypothetical protein ElyMa_001954400 [Elysia marginata]|uniref:Uncharacterized protein n=1 Tax=Elysia marginata TaxID=1093978 RepID=A0AAV4EYZ7_9GAST|nr:hypothetical protein ElyMa_001954400 [Elysia marginata]
MTKKYWGSKFSDLGNHLQGPLRHGDQGERGGVVSASDSRSRGRGFDSRPCHVAIALGKQFTLTFPSPPTCKMGPSYRLQMHWSAGALVALLCGDTVTLSNKDKFLERD